MMVPHRTRQSEEGIHEFQKPVHVSPEFQDAVLGLAHKVGKDLKMHRGDFFIKGQDGMGKQPGQRLALIYFFNRALSSSAFYGKQNEPGIAAVRYGSGKHVIQEKAPLGGNHAVSRQKAETPYSGRR